MLAVEKTLEVVSYHSQALLKSLGERAINIILISLRASMNLTWELTWQDIPTSVFTNSIAFKGIFLLRESDKQLDWLAVF